ncbi:hypothetical protein PKF023_16810 [Polynucleobacter yangtzensis]|jgi:hypothetical protein|uniref:Uncharacterized protein n=1 Tax=Polynucleobacter yangtzensis TaxID=1743159 RepID=A0A9C7C6I4_9BURK|nr:hypothetical protein [Polynucleobacter yangtzensis]BDT77878.1 hypothetical protein PKF023_16810 [Polynucleobacter yangtzensis]
MKTFEAYVRAGGFVVRTMVVADGLQQAIYILQGQFGADNVVHLPREI